jgi:polar amino acid transport system substrate-binding protein
MNRRSSVLLGTGFLSLMLLLAGCGITKRATREAPSPATGLSRIRVGLATNYPPLAFRQNGSIKGIEPDLARQLSDDSGLDVTIVEVAWEKLIPALRDGQIDVIMSGMSITEERGELVSFAEPYLRVGQMSLIRAEDIADLAEPSVMFSKAWRVGFMNNTTGEFFAREHLPRSELVGFDSIEAGIAALHAKRIDYFIHDAPTIWRITLDLETRDDALLALFNPLTEEYLAWAVRKSDTELLGLLSTHISQWKQSGQLQRILNRWIPVRVELRPAGGVNTPIGAQR